MAINNERKEVVKAGFNRFYSEGYTKWSAENIKKIFDGKLGSEDINFLKSLEDKGYIELVGETECFVRILKKIDKF